MPTARPHLARPVAAVRPRRAGAPGQDRVVTGLNAMVVLDGASHPDSGDRDGGWLAETLGSTIRDRLDAEPGAPLAEVLAGAIAATTHVHRLTADASPSTTVSIVRWTNEHVDALVLGDSPVVALTPTGDVTVVRDDRLETVASKERNAFRLAAIGERDARWRELVEAERRYRNQPGGYWIASAEPEAARRAVTVRWPIGDVRAVVAMTDGVAAGVDRYGVPADWRAALALALDDPGRLIDVVTDAEATDPDRERWPRSKTHDDKAVAVVRLWGQSRGSLPRTLPNGSEHQNTQRRFRTTD